MNAAKTIAAPDVREIPLDLLDDNPLNPRRTIDEGALAELAASIQQSGLSQSLLVRPAPDQDGLVEERFQIVCGHRRSRACALAGKETVRCEVREMTDAEAAEIALVDNLQREDVGALEEAEAFGSLLALHGTVEAVAARVGKDVAHVAKRLKLRTLGVWQRDALHRKLITVDHALLLARLGTEEQDAALKWTLDSHAGSKTPIDKVIEASAKTLAEGRKNRYMGLYWEPESVKQLKLHIEETSGRKLSRAPWSLDDAQLVADKGACSTCPSNTKANTALFADLAIKEATCADGACFEQKREAFVRIRLRTATEDVLPPLRLSWKPTSVAPRMLIDDVKPVKGSQTNTVTSKPKLDQVFKNGQWIEAKKDSCPDVIAGITVDWNDDVMRGYGNTNMKLRKPGEKLLVCIAPKCKAHPKDWEKAAHANRSGEKQESWEDRQAREKKELAAFAATEEPLRRALYDAILAKITPEQIKRVVLNEGREEHAFASTFFGIARALHIPAEKVMAHILAAPAAELDELLLHSRFGRELEASHLEITQKDKGRGKLRELAKIAGVNADAIIQRIMQEQKAEAKKVDVATPPPKKVEAKNGAKKTAKKGGNK
jgi:ParB/RepB/Spo0J family partition protein